MIIYAVQSTVIIRDEFCYHLCIATCIRLFCSEHRYVTVVYNA